MYKHILFALIIWALMPLSSMAQDSSRFVYCEIVGQERFFSNKVTVTVNFGQQMKFFADNRMKDSRGRPIVFNNMIDALNHLGSEGWELVQAYTVTNDNNTIYHYVMKKPFADLDQEDRDDLRRD